MPTFAIMLLYIAEHPNRPFFFGIPAWVIGAVIVALEVLNDLAYRQWTQLLTVILASYAIALVAKKVGLLSAYDQVPDLQLGGCRGTRKDAAAGRGKGPRSKPAASGGLKGRFGRQEEAEIVAMPTTRPRPRPTTPVVPDDVSADDLALDALLDKISASGMDSLTDAERQQLEDIARAATTNRSGRPRMAERGALQREQDRRRDRQSDSDPLGEPRRSPSTVAASSTVTTG